MSSGKAELWNTQDKLTEKYIGGTYVFFVGAGDGNRTRVVWLETRSTAIVLHPRRRAGI